MTNGFGRNTRTIFRFAAASGVSRLDYALKSDSTIILCAFNEDSKENGFFSKKLNVAGNPVKLIMSSDLYYFPDISFVRFTTFLVKAKFADTYLLTRSSTGEYPNLNITKDFKTFQRITNLTPTKNIIG